MLIEPVQGESGVNLIDSVAAGRDPLRVRRGRRRAGLRRGPDRHGADRLAVGLRADRRRPGRDDAGQGPGRRAADRRAGDRSEAAGCLRARRPRLDVRGRAGGLVGRERRLDVIDDEAFLRGVRERGERLLEGLRELPGVLSARGRGLMVACEIESGAPEVAKRALLEQKLIINATGPTTLRFLPPLIVTDEQVDDALGRLRALL